MATINLENAEVLDFSQSANYINGEIYQYGRTVSLSITAFIYPGNDIESTRFRKIDTTERSHIDEILGQNNSGFVESISINGTIIQNVKILSYDFATQEASIEDHINLLRVNMSLEFYEAFDHTSDLKATDSEIYKATDFLGVEYSKYFESFDESFSFSLSNDYAHSFTQTLNFNLRKNTPTDVDFSVIAKEIAMKAFDVSGSAVAKVGYIDDRYAEFIRTVQGNGVFSESYDTINNTFSLFTSGSGNTGGTGNHYWIYKRVHEAAYAMGVLAGHLTESGKLGIVGTFPADDVNDEINAYFAGARTVRSDIKQSVSFIESWYDPGKAAEMTSAQIATGADVIFTLANNFTACEDAGILCFGNFADESPYSPTTIVSSAMAVWDPDIMRIIDAWWDFKENGKPHSGKPRIKYASMAEGGTIMAPLNPALLDRIPENARKAVEQTIADIMSGDLVVELDVSVPKSD